ncbi:MAG: hypothetical protein DWQ01_00130 [Planctomycetota bacterium]|nr:MAG: hypothetical protein DWQ01_00130 [Planctomycetota bacterium]
MPPVPYECPHCGYEIATYSEGLEALESGARCLLCGSQLQEEALARMVDSWSEADLFQEGQDRAEAEAELEDDEDLCEGIPDFGDEGEEVEDPML